ncbi:hypothetical protein [Tsukamurella hominis]|uniref:hypothetical protein n=1 Tax=Tsukamurella hominis TaxID=1970232 RepID=UPI0039E9E589
MTDWLDTLDPTKVVTAIDQLAASAPEYIAKQAGGDVRFALWLHLVDRQLRRLVGVGHADLVDCTWRDWFDSELSPREAVEQASEYDELLQMAAID